MRFFLLLCYLFIGKLTIGQTPQPPPTKTQKIPLTKYTLQQRLSFYPFNKSNQIKLVSFGEQQDTQNIRGPIKFGLPILNDTVCFQRLDQIKVLTPKQIDTLTDILYNACSKWTIIERTEIGCYFPRNAIVFFDESNKPFEYIEICFECHGIKNSSEKISVEDVCDIMYKELQLFFKQAGLKTSAAELLKKHNSR